jgi:hypothetical protein
LLHPNIGGPATEILLSALADSDQKNWDNARLAFDQLFHATASGKYLNRLMSDDGVVRPPLLGINDDLFRKLGIQAIASKLTLQSLLGLLEVFYGSSAVRSFAETELGGPFALALGLSLEWALDEKTAFRVEFTPEMFTNINAARAEEVAAVITKAMHDERSDGFALHVVDPETGLDRVQVFSGSLGLTSSVRFTGGTAQPRLQFNTHKNVYSGDAAGSVWVFTSPTQGVTRFSLTTVGLPAVDLGGVEEGDYVVVGPGVGTVTPASYNVLGVTTEWSGANYIQSVDLVGDLGFIGAFVQASNSQFSFFSPTKRTTLAGTRTVAATTPESGVEISVPATTQVVVRTEETGSYAHVPGDTSGAVGPYVFDPRDGIQVTSVQTALTAPMLKGQHYDKVSVVSTEGFPSTGGFFVLAFGRSIQSQLVRVITVASPTELIVDFGAETENDYPAGTTVDFVPSKAPYVPESGEFGAFIATGTATGRLVAEQMISNSVEAGCNLSFEVTYPGDRGLGGEGRPTDGDGKLSDIVQVFGGDT